MDKEIALMKQRIDNIDDKMDKMDKKLDRLTTQLLDPDSGVVSRVNTNTQARLTMQKALWTLWTVVVGSLVAYFFSNK